MSGGAWHDLCCCVRTRRDTPIWLRSGLGARAGLAKVRAAAGKCCPIDDGGLYLVGCGLCIGNWERWQQGILLQPIGLALFGSAAEVFRCVPGLNRDDALAEECVKPGLGLFCMHAVPA